MGENGKQSINSIIMECLRTGDLSAFNETMEESVNSFLGGVEKTLHTVGDIRTNGPTKSMSQHFESYSAGTATDAQMQRIRKEKEERLKRARAERERQEMLKQQNAVRKSASAENLPVPFNSVGEVSNVLYTVTGGVGLSFSAISVFRGLWGVVVNAHSPVGTLIGVGLAAVFAALIKVGVSQKKMLVKAKRYAELSGKRQYIEIEQLARSVNQSPRRTLSDVKKMIKKGFFPEGHIDDEKTTLMLSDSVFSEYMRSVSGRKAIDSKKNEVIDTTARDITSERTSDRTELEKMIEEGSEYIDTLHRLNAEIPGEVITQKLSRLENLLKDIFTCVEKHPEQMKRMHEVMNYYIPTVIKLVEAYKEYDSISEAGKEILDAKKQIEGSIDTINDALKKILNNLFRDSVWDVTTDASVLNTMLAQKGLASPFKDKED